MIIHAAHTVSYTSNKQPGKSFSSALKPFIFSLTDDSIVFRTNPKYACLILANEHISSFDVRYLLEMSTVRFGLLPT